MAERGARDGLCLFCNGRVPVVKNRLANHNPSPPPRRSSSGSAERVGDVLDRVTRPGGRGGFLLREGCAGFLLGGVIALLLVWVAWFIADPVAAVAALVSLLVAVFVLEPLLTKSAIARKGGGS